MDIKSIQHGTCILQMHFNEDKRNRKIRTHLAETPREDYNLIHLTHLVQKVVNARPLNYMHIVPLLFDLDRNDVVGVGYKLECMV